MGMGGAYGLMGLRRPQWRWKRGKGSPAVFHGWVGRRWAGGSCGGAVCARVPQGHVSEGRTTRLGG